MSSTDETMEVKVGSVEEEVRTVDLKVVDLESQISSLDGKVTEVENKIGEVENKIGEVEDEIRKLFQLPSPTRRQEKLLDYLCKEENQLRVEENQLRVEENLLREKENLCERQLCQLHEKEDGVLPPASKKPHLDSVFIEHLKNVEITKKERDDDDDGDDEDNDASGNTPTKRRIYNIMNITEYLPSFSVKFNSGILVRESYVKLYNNYIEKYNHILVTGNPGIGKSIFLFYVLKRLLETPTTRKQVFILASATNQLYYYLYLKNDGTTFKSYIEVIEAVLEDQSDNDIYFLFDCATQLSFVPNPVLAQMCKKSVVFASPQISNYHDYWKHCIIQRGKQVYMPVWSQSEVMDMCDHYNFSNVEEIMDIYNIAGGIPRYLFGGDKCVIKRLIDQKIDSCCNEAKLLAFISEFIISEAENTSHMLLRLCPKEEDNQVIFVDFASHYVQDRLVRKMLRKKKIEFLEMMNTIKNNSLYAVFRGRCFETYAHFMFQEGGVFDVRSLTSSESSQLTIKPGKNDTFDKEINLLENNVYYTPKSACFPSVDSLLPPSSAFLMTIAQNHPVKVSGLRMAHKLLDNRPNIKLYFVVPEDMYGSYTEQRYTNKGGEDSKRPPKDFSQWALCLPLNY